MSKFVTILVVDDDDNIEFEKKVAKEDIMHWKTVYDEEGMQDVEEIAIPITYVKNPQLLDYVVQYGQFMRTADYPKDERKKDTKIEIELTAWEKKIFLDEMPKSSYGDLMNLVNFLDFAPMLEALCLLLVRWIENKTLNEIQNSFAPPKVIINTH